MTTLELMSTRDTLLGEGLPIRRALPHRTRRLIGAWCFLDQAGPTTLTSARDMRVGPHPHTGLQTFSWMMAGEILHRDSLGYEQVLRPGQVNLMTAGHGISHSEEAIGAEGPLPLHLAQLWIALPDAVRDMPPSFEHYPDLPTHTQQHLTMTVLVGRYQEWVSPVRVHSPLLAMDLHAHDAAAQSLTLNPDFEHGVLVMEGSVHVNDQPLAPGTFAYLPVGAHELKLGNTEPMRCLLLGGAPLNEPVLLWWNFVARSDAEIAQLTAQWNAGDARFGTVRGYDGPPLVAPPVPNAHLKS